MNISAAAANAVWAGASQLSWRRFRRALQEPLRTQRDILGRYLSENADTVVGRRYGFEKLSAHAAGDVIDAYREAVPVASYDDLEPLIARIAAGEPGVMTRAGVRRLAPSSGSTSAAKLVPHNGPLQHEFSVAVDAWIADLYRTFPAIIGGRAYWSVTPAISFEATAKARLGSPSAVPIGFDDDSAYLGSVRQRVIRTMLAVPDAIKRVDDPDAFRYLTLLFLLRARDLRLVSVWHPSYLSRLLDAIPEYFDRLLDDIARGTLTPPGRIADDTRASLSRTLRPDPARAAELRRRSGLTPHDVWPHLALVSCWGDGPASPFVMQLAGRLNGVAVQHKGLIATEAIVSIPFARRHPVAIRSHFFEFLDPRGRSRLAHELEQGVEYAPIVTTGGGLYRYRLGDLVVVDGWLDATPSLRFVGRGDRVSDRFGEKLSDGFVATVIASLFQGRESPRFAMLAPEVTSDGCAYTLLVDSGAPLSSELAATLERALRGNPHYSWCVDLGQLRPARVVAVGPHADRAYVDECVARGQRLGDVKPVSLHPESGWESRLRM